MEAYDQWEERFLADYGEELVRNILGEYEPGSLDIRKEAYEKELEELSRKRQQKKKLEEKSLERQRNLERAQEELRLWLAKKEIAHSRQKEEKEGFDRGAGRTESGAEILGYGGEIPFRPGENP